ncbi:zinc-dependent alcohol dehydrogenase [Histidinibacterium aquaticum]|uniref:Glutathione-dependent formaldehyde dehydrogenase n=1 Tax=Histidinibacterium aquaticum TaxID=2613962 RepID=A0A5J5GM32_9RHOB|nr:zinc-dependent alcohol dehydrogenase [Histidinibacterium aquaticum]KAA9009220.1 glutathione-dependent formaldehyde dehydrogenase [Histidinibacterium aquaticum]
MRAVTYHGTGDMRVDTVPDPTIQHPRDAILKVSSTAICGSDLHIYDGFMPEMKTGDVIGHEFMGEIVETGPEVKGLSVGDRVVIPFNVTCGRCHFCERQLFSMCDNSNPDGEKLEKLYGQAGAGLFGYSHLFGGYDGGQAEYVRVPFADTGHLKVPSHISDDSLLFLTDIFPTGWQAALNADVTEGSTVAVWGAGPVGLFAIKSALLLGAETVYAIDTVPERLRLAEQAGAVAINSSEQKPYEALMEKTNERLPECVIDAVGLEAHGAGVLDTVYDKAKTVTFQETDRPHALREAILCTRKAGTVSLAGVYAGMVDKFPIGAAFGKALSFKMGQTHVLKHIPDLLRRIEEGQIDPSFLITHRGTLEDAPDMYKTFRDKTDDCIKCVMTP